MAESRSKTNLVHSEAVRKPLVAIVYSIIKWMLYKIRPRPKGWGVCFAGCWGGVLTPRTALLRFPLLWRHCDMTPPYWRYIWCEQKRSYNVGIRRFLRLSYSFIYFNWCLIPHTIICKHTLVHDVTLLSPTPTWRRLLSLSPHVFPRKSSNLANTNPNTENIQLCMQCTGVRFEA